MEYPWYERVETDQLEQGDFLTNCPLLDAPTTLNGPPPEGAAIPDVSVAFHDTVVLTQSCDLVGSSKVRRVLLCPVVLCGRAVQGLSGKALERAFEELEKHRVFKRHLLDPCDLEGHAHPHRVALFEDVFTLSLNYVRDVLIPAQKLRLRLLPPYREHLAQRYGMFVLRVGYPVDMKKIPRA